MRVRWTTDAVADLERIIDYIAEDSVDSALLVARQINESVAALQKSPRRGRAGWVEGTRELVLSPLPYIVVYRLKHAIVEVLHVHHGAQNWRH